MTLADSSEDATHRTSKLNTSYKCSKCRDTSWIVNNNYARRCECYQLDYIKRLWENYGIKPDEAKKINEYIPCDSLTNSLKNKSIIYINQFEKIYSTRENSFGILGQSGSGKSHISIAIGAALVNKNYKVVYMPYLEVMRELKANTMDDEYYIKLISRYKQAQVLVIDDLFKDKVKKDVKTNKMVLSSGLSEADMKHIYPVLNYRYNNKLPTIFSTECDVEMLLNLDEALAGRIIESCGDNITVIKGSKYNYRVRKIKINKG